MEHQPLTAAPDDGAVGEPSSPWGRRVLLALVALAGLAVGVGIPVAVSALRTDAEVITVEVTDVDVDAATPALRAPDAAPSERTVDSYRGYGTWVDVFDFAPAYAGESPPVDAGAVAEMAETGVRTLYLQAARLDDRTPDGLEHPWRLADFIWTAHAAGIDVVAWYLPLWGDDDADLVRLRGLHEFAALGQRFDGVGVDIEWTADGLDDEERSRRLVDLSQRFRAESDGDPISAIVLPPVLIEVVNEQYWPGFPWEEIASSYDVWMPMSYWSFRSDESGYGDGYAYNEESVRRLRDNLGDPGALVHPIGGIGTVDGVDDPLDPEEPLASFDDVELFGRSIVDTDGIGGSIYDWNTLESTVRADVGDALSALFPPP